MYLQLRGAEKIKFYPQDFFLQRLFEGFNYFLAPIATARAQKSNQNPKKAEVKKIPWIKRFFRGPLNCRYIVYFIAENKQFK